MTRINKMIIAWLLLIISFFFVGKPFGLLCNGVSLGLFLHDLITNVIRKDNDS